MEEPIKSEELSKEQKPTPNEQAIEDLSWDVPFLRTIGNFFIREGKAVKNGWVAVAILCGITLFVTYSCTSDSAKEKLSGVQSELRDAKQDRDKYFNALQPWQAMAAGIFPNQPPEKQLELLTSEIAYITNILNISGGGLKEPAAQAV